MTKRLFDLDLTRIDRVGKGSNPGSKVVLYKSDDTSTTKTAADTSGGTFDFSNVEWTDLPTTSSGGVITITHTANGTTPIDLSAAPVVEEGEATVPTTREDLDGDVLALFEEVEKERDDAVAKAEAAELALEEPSVSETESEVDELEEFMKSAPESVVAALAKAEAAETRIAKMEDEAASAKFTAIAKADLGHVGDEAGEVGNVLKTLAAVLTEDEYKAVFRTLKASAAQAEKAFKEISETIGTVGAAVSAAPEQMKEMAKAHQAENGGSLIAAMQAVRKTNPEILSEYDAERVTHVPNQNGA